MEVLKKHGVALNFTLAHMNINMDMDMDSSEALEDPDALAWQVSISTFFIYLMEVECLSK